MQMLALSLVIPNDQAASLVNALYQAEIPPLQTDQRKDESAPGYSRVGLVTPPSQIAMQVTRFDSREPSVVKPGLAEQLKPPLLQP